MRRLALFALAVCAACAPATSSPTSAPAPPAVAASPSSTAGGAFPVLPRSDLTPGQAAPATAPNGTATAICAVDEHGRRTFHTSDVRPGRAESAQLKRDALARYGIPADQAPAYEADHLIPLGLGGDPRAPANVWPEPWERDAHHPAGVALPGTGAQTKDRAETAAERRLCVHPDELARLQRAFATAWPSLLPDAAQATPDNDDEEH